jgi:hypothetical protein
LGAAFDVVDDTTNAHFAASGNVAAGESASAVLGRDSEYRTKITIDACRLEVWPG